MATEESEFQAQVIQAAEEWLGWRVVHFRPAKTGKGWRTPVQGSLGKGWPDLTLVHESGRLIFAELKGRSGTLTEAQADVLDALRVVAWRNEWVEVYVWSPQDWEHIVKVLSAGQAAPRGSGAG